MNGRLFVGVFITLTACVPAEDLKTYSDGSTARGDTRMTVNPAEPDVGAGAPDVRNPPATPPATTPPTPAASEAAGSDQPMESAPLDRGSAAIDVGTSSSAPATAAVDAAGVASEPPSEPGVSDMVAAEPEPEPVAVPEPAPEPDPAVEAPAPRPQFRFVRFVADGAVQGPYTALAEFNVLDGAGQPIDRTGWVASADSEELTYVGGARAALAIDGVTISLWHTAWFQVNPPPSHPHTLDLDMGVAHEVSGFRYLGRQDASLDGRVTQYRFFVSVDGIEWGEPVVAGTLENSTAEQEIRLPP